MRAIIPPYLLARVASAREPHLARAAVAARTTLAARPSDLAGRSQLRLSVEPGGTLVAERIAAACNVPRSAATPAAQMDECTYRPSTSMG